MSAAGELVIEDVVRSIKARDVDGYVRRVSLINELRRRGQAAPAGAVDEAVRERRLETKTDDSGRSFVRLPKQMELFR